MASRSVGRSGAASIPELRTTHAKNNVGALSRKGGVITMSAQSAKLGLSMISIAVLARLLTPQDFGLVAAATGAIGVLSIFKDVGLSTATVQNSSLTNAQVSNLFWINAVTGVTLCGVIAALATPVARFFGEPSIVGVISALSITYVLNGATVQHLALLQRSMRFGAIAVIEVTAAAVGLGVAVVAASLGYRYWALVLNILALEAMLLVGAWTASRWMPAAPRLGVGTRGLVRFGAQLTAANLFLALVGSLDRVLVARVHGAEALGLYSRAQALLMRPLDQYMAPMNAVALPALAAFQDDPARYRSAFLKAYAIVATLVAPVAATLIALSSPLTAVMLGRRWDGSAGMVAAFSLAALYLPLAATSRWLFSSQGRGADLLVANATVAGVTVAAIGAGLPFGAFGVALSFSLSGCIVRLPILYSLAGRRGPVSTRDLWLALVPHVPSWVVIAALVFATRWALSTSHPVLQLGVVSAVATAASISCALVNIAQRDALAEILRLLKQRRRARTLISSLAALREDIQWHVARLSAQAALARHPVPAMQLSELKTRVNAAKVDVRRLSMRNLATIRQVSAASLVSGSRFDLGAKHLYVRINALTPTCKHGRDVYCASIKAFNSFDEGDGSGKTGRDAFESAFNETIESLRTRHFDPGASLVPVTPDGVIIDGAHRVAACLHHDIPVSVVTVSQDIPGWDYKFFQSRNMPQSYMDAAALELCAVGPQIYAALLFPVAHGRDHEATSVLAQYGPIVYQKTLTLSAWAATNLVRSVYRGEPWLGDRYNQFAGAREKAEACFDGPDALRLVLFCAPTLQAATRLKATVRAMYGVGNHSIHTSDTRLQALEIAQVLLNDNSLSHLERCRHASTPRFDSLVEQVRSRLRRRPRLAEQYCLGGSAALAAYGLRDVDDLDYLDTGNERQISFGCGVNRHVTQYRHYAKPVDEIVLDPSNHFYYSGLKIATPDVIKTMKLRRGEAKDAHDVELLEAVLHP